MQMSWEIIPIVSIFNKYPLRLSRQLSGRNRNHSGGRDRGRIVAGSSTDPKNLNVLNGEWRHPPPLWEWNEDIRVEKKKRELEEEEEEWPAVGTIAEEEQAEEAEEAEEADGMGIENVVGSDRNHNGTRLRFLFFLEAQHLVECNNSHPPPPPPPPPPPLPPPRS